MWNRSAPYLIFLLTLVSTFSHSQTDFPPAYRFFPSKEVRVTNLHLRNAKSADSTATLAATLSTIFDDPQVCCGKDSALGDEVFSADSDSIEGLARTLQGRHMLDDGRPILVSAQYVSADSAKAEQVIAPLLTNKPLLMEWNYHFYVVQGVVFSERAYDNGFHEYLVRQLLLSDPRFTDERMRVAFHANNNSWHEVQGFLILSAAPE